MDREDKRKDKTARKPYKPPTISAEDDFSEETLLQFAPTGPFGARTACGGSGCISG